MDTYISEDIMPRKHGLNSVQEPPNPMKYIEIRLRRIPRPLYASDRLILYGKELTEDMVKAKIRQIRNKLEKEK